MIDFFVVIRSYKSKFVIVSFSLQLLIFSTFSLIFISFDLRFIYFIVSMINSRLSRSTKSSAFSKNEVIKREFECFKKMIKNKTFVNSRSFRRDLEDVETTSIFFHFVVDSKSFIIFASFIAFTSTSFIIVMSTSFITFMSIFVVTLFLVSAFSDESTQNSIFEEMNRDVLIRLLTTLISSFAESSNVFVADIVANSSSIRTSIFMIEFVVIIAEKSTT